MCGDGMKPFSSVALVNHQHDHLLRIANIAEESVNDQLAFVHSRLLRSIREEERPIRAFIWEPD
jgi:hypothetical protein